MAQRECRMTGAAMLLAGAMVAAAGATPAAAQDGGFVSSVRVGVLAHDYGPFTVHDEDAVDLNLEVLFASPDFLEPILAPRPHIGVTVNSRSDATDQLYAGLTWSFDLTDSLFFEIGGGGAVHNGETGRVPGDRTLLGCRFLFRGLAGLGLRLAEQHSLSLHFDHISNAYLCGENEGLETVGIRYGYDF
jgi:lipid A 3-O-deacylase